MSKTIAIINDPDVTIGTLPTSIETVNAWEAEWKKFSINDNYIILGAVSYTHLTLPTKA